MASAVNLDFASTTALNYSTLEEANQVKPAKTGPKLTEPEVKCKRCLLQGAAHVFDSSDPAPDFDLGSPNENCENAGPGRGEAG